MCITEICDPNTWDAGTNENPPWGWGNIVPLLSSQEEDHTYKASLDHAARPR